MKALLVFSSLLVACVGSAFAADLDGVDDNSYVIHVALTDGVGTTHGSWKGRIFGDKAGCEAFLKNDDDGDLSWQAAKESIAMIAAIRNGTLSPFSCVSVKEERALEATNPGA